MREAIFNLIGQDVSDLKVLDLFAGTGILGIEALSRGALLALFIDISTQSIKLIKKNLILCGYDSQGTILKKDLLRGMPWENPPMEENYDLVFIDPPYGKKLIPPLLKKLEAKEMLASPSLVVAESSKFDILPVKFGKLQLVDTRTYGDTKIDIYQYEDNL